MQVQDREFLLSSPQSNGRRIKLVADMTDAEIKGWEVSNFNGQDTLVLKGASTVLCRMVFVPSEGKYMGRDIRGGVSTLTPVEPQQTPVEAVQSALMARIASNQTQQRDDSTGSPHAVQNWVKGYDAISEQLNSCDKKHSQAIAVVGCNRPEYLSKVLAGLAQNDLSDYDLYLFLDHPPRESEKPLVQQQAGMALDGMSVIRTPFNFGCGQHLIEIRRQLFDRMGYERIFVFEDDMVPSSNYVAYCERLLEWGLANYTNVGAVQGWHKCVMPPEDKKKRVKQVHATYTNWWGYLMTREAWDKIKGVLYKYRDSFLQRSYKVRPTVPILQYFKPMAQRNFHLLEGGFQPDEGALRHRRNLFDSPPSGQDGATWLAFDNANLVRLAPTVNRGLYIGEVGIHSTAEIFRKDRFDRMTLEVYPNDSRMKNFEARK